MRSHRFDSVVSAPVMDHLIRRECARADRNGQVFSLVLFRVAGGGKKRRSLAAHRLARVMLKRARLTDEVGWVGEQHLAALLPDTTPQGAQSFADGVSGILARRELRPLAMIYTYPRDGVSAMTSPESDRAAVLGHINGAVARRINGNGHAHHNRNGHAHVNGDSLHNGNGRSNGNGNGNGHGYLNGNSNGHVKLSAGGHGHSSAVTVAECEQATETSFNVAIALQERPEPAAKIAQPVTGIEELLTFPMPRWKRVIDIISALALMMVFSPILAIAALAIKITSPGPVVYKQKRSGLGGKPFLIYKFRTMIVGAEKQQQELRKLNEQDGPAFKLTNDPRVTRVGHFLRKTSIDELPQLLNILRGEMSLVGPRPLPIAEQEGCEQWQRHRLNVTPGITCIWQVKGRSQVTFAEWVRMDVEYIRRRTLIHDMIILFSTIPSVLLRKGAR